MTTKEKRIPIVELFGPTIQGEGIDVGRRVVFLRVGLCDSKCTKCDSMHAVDPVLVKQGARWMTQKEIAAELLEKAGSTDWVILSGGNPAIHDLSELCDLLHDAGKMIAIETQGVRLPDWLYKVDSIVVSPKGIGMGETFRTNDFIRWAQACGKIYDAIDPGDPTPTFCLKVVVFSAQDLEFAISIQDLWEGAGGPPAEYFLSQGNPDFTQYKNPDFVAPEISTFRNDRLDGAEILIDEIVQNPHLSEWRFMPQLHTLIWGTKEGV